MAHNIKDHHENMGIGANWRWPISPKLLKFGTNKTVFKDISQVAQNPIKTNGSLQANATF